MERMIMNAQREAAHQMAMPEPRESLGDLLGDLMTQSTELVKGEVAPSYATRRACTARRR